MDVTDDIKEGSIPGKFFVKNSYGMYIDASKIDMGKVDADSSAIAECKFVVVDKLDIPKGLKDNVYRNGKFFDGDFI